MEYTLEIDGVKRQMEYTLTIDGVERALTLEEKNKILDYIAGCYGYRIVRKSSTEKQKGRRVHNDTT